MTITTRPAEVSLARFIHKLALRPAETDDS